MVCSVFYQAEDGIRDTSVTGVQTCALRVWPDGKLPEGALPEKEFIQSLIQRDRAQLDALRPRDRESLEHFKKVMEPAWRHTLQIHFPEHELLVEAGEVSKAGSYTVS